MRDNITSFLNKMDQILPTDMKQSIVSLAIKDINLNIIRKQKENKIKMNEEFIKVFNTVYHFGGLRLYQKNERFMLENSTENKSIYLYSQRNIISHDNGILPHPDNIVPQNQMIPLTNNTSSQSQDNNDIVLFNGTPNAQRKIKIYVMYI